tara:strand:+ start:1471 stop:2172 length:702 start_codon:yes stop_codon:yes gene_type:complete
MGKRLEVFSTLSLKGLQMESDKAQREKFSKVASGGYRISEVGRFLKKVDLLIDKEERDSLSSELEAVRFSITKRTGYSPKEVDDHLDSLARTYGKVGVSKVGTKYSERSSFSREGSGDENSQKSISVIESKKLRTLTPPIVDGVGYVRDEVDEFLSTVADSLERFESVQGKNLDELRADQYIAKSDEKPLLAGDQVRYALFAVSENGGYEMLGVDAAVNRLAEALDYHWSRTS